MAFKKFLGHERHIHRSIENNPSIIENGLKITKHECILNHKPKAVIDFKGIDNTHRIVYIEIKKNKIEKQRTIQQITNYRKLIGESARFIVVVMYMPIWLIDLCNSLNCELVKLSATQLPKIRILHNGFEKVGNGILIRKNVISITPIVGNRGRVVIPKEIREKMKIKEGDTIFITIEKDV